MKTLAIITFAALIAFTTACSLQFNLATTTAGPGPVATETLAPTASSPYAWPAESSACTLVTSETQVLFNRPSIESPEFAEIEAGFSIQVTGRTADGWVGFDPAIAQAANIGIFRLRWAHFDQVELSGDCVSVPQATWVPVPAVCYFMPMENVPVYANADVSSEVIATLQMEDFAAITAFTNTGFAQVDLGAGNTGLTGGGWVEERTLNMNGGTCDELPEMTP